MIIQALELFFQFGCLLYADNQLPVKTALEVIVRPNDGYEDWGSFPYAEVVGGPKSCFRLT